MHPLRVHVRPLTRTIATALIWLDSEDSLGCGPVRSICIRSDLGHSISAGYECKRGRRAGHGPAGNGTRQVRVPCRSVRTAPTAAAVICTALAD